MVKDGMLDLSQWDFEKDGSVSLTGDWRFVWRELVEPMPLDAFREKYTKTYRVPAIWNPTLLVEDESFLDKWEAIRLGYATYALEIRLPKNAIHKSMAINFFVVSATKMLVLSEDAVNQLGKLSIGEPYEDPNRNVRWDGFSSMLLNPQGHRTVMVLVQQAYPNAGFSHGFMAPPILHLKAANPAPLIHNVMSLIVGIWLGLGVYFLMVFLLRRQDLHLFYFSSSVIASAFIFSYFYSRYLYFFEPSTAAQELLHVTGLMICTIHALSLYMFYRCIFPDPWFKPRMVWALGCSTVLALCARFFFYHTVTEAIQICAYLSCVAAVQMQGTLVLVKRSFRGERLAIEHLLAAVPALLGFAFLATNFFVASEFKLPFSIQFLILSSSFLLVNLLQALIVAKETAKAFSLAEHLSENLQREVEAQTETLHVTTQEALREKAHAQTAELEAQSLREKAEEQALALQSLDKQKTAFFQNMSHELRTPLTLILNPLDNQTKSQPENVELAVATKNARRLLRLVNQLLDFQKLDAGKKKLTLAPVDMNKFTRICGDYFNSACSTKGVRFRVTSNRRVLSVEETPIWALGEVDSMEKVAFNYLSNALKYTPKEGTIELGLTYTETRARLFVRDSGQGISLGAQEKLFKVFSQVDESASRAFEGTGLGLALVKSLVEEMGGEVGVESDLGRGSTFWADFALCNAPDSFEDLNFEVKSWLVEQGQGETGTGEEEFSLELHDSTNGSAELVLVVDDLADMRDLISGSLKKRNYRIATAPNGKRGVEIAKEICPDLIITDWMMPQMTGPELIKCLKADEALNAVPIILLTAKSDEESKLIGTDMGADSFLGKPFNDQELGSIVKNLLSLKSREREVEKLNHMLTETVLKRYISPVLVDKIISGEICMDKPAEMRNITVLFSDLSGFTTTSEKLGPKVISAFLNEYLTKMNDIIFEHGGTIDKFIGDAIMVMFGAPQDIPLEEQAQRATDCAQAMQREMEKILKEWESEGAGHLRMRIGLHQGEAIVGNFGSDKRSDYTCIGPTVNLAARIESAGEPGRVFVSETLQAHLESSAVEDAGQFELKGIEGKTTLYRLSGS